MGKTGSRGPIFWSLAVLVLVGLVAQACSDNKGPSGPTFGAGQTGHADSAAEIRVQVAINPNSIELGRRAGVTVLVTNTNGRPLERRHVQVSTDVGTLDKVDGFTDAAGKFVTFIKITAQDAANAAGLTAATVTAFVEGASGTGTVNFVAPAEVALQIIPATVTRTFGAGSGGSTCATTAFTIQFTVTGGVPPYTFSTSGTIGGTVSAAGLYSAPSLGVVGVGFTVTETVTVVDSEGTPATATVTVSCVKST